MNERASAWNPVPDINDGFDSISFSYESRLSNDLRSILVLMNGSRTLSLKFTGVIALHFEDDCPLC